MTIQEAREALVAAVCIYAGSCGKGTNTEWGATSNGVIGATNALIAAVRSEIKADLMERADDHEAHDRPWHADALRDYADALFPDRV